MTLLAAIVGGPAERRARRIDQLLAWRTLSFRGTPTVTGSETAHLGGSAAPPLRARSGRWMAVAAGRLDNRTDIAAWLGRGGEGRWCDERLIAEAWARDPEGCGERLLGDWALIAWDEDKRRLTLARSPLGTLALYHGCDAGQLMVAALPQAIVAAGMPAVLDRGHAATIAAGVEDGQEETMFRGIRRVPPGQALTLDGRGAVRARRALWKPSVDVWHGADAAERFRALADEAVRCRLRRPDGPVASQLSAGRDSGLVTALAATIDTAPIEAITFAPRPGFHDDGLAHLLQDESPIAARLAARHGARHHVIRPVLEKGDLLAATERLLPYAAAPWSNLASLRAWDAMGRNARDLGASILLTGQVGNHTVSAGGVSMLAALRSEEGWRPWWKAARPLSIDPRFGWGTVLHQSFGTALPTGLIERLRAWRRPLARTMRALPLLAQDFRRLAEKQRASASECRQTPRHVQASWLASADMSDLTLLGAYGVELRDPTADVRLADFTLSLSASDMVDGRGGRPLFERAFDDLFPPEARAETRRGVQQADWMEQIPASGMRDVLDHIAAHSLVPDLVDLDAARALVDRWPSAPTTAEQRATYRGALFETVGLALFVAHHF